MTAEASRPYTTVRLMMTSISNSRYLRIAIVMATGMPMSATKAAPKKATTVTRVGRSDSRTGRLPSLDDDLECHAGEPYERHPFDLKALVAAAGPVADDGRNER